MRGLKFEDLLAIVDFLYYGEANIYQENLDDFLKIAEELDLKGLNGGDGGSEKGERYKEDPSKHSAKPTVLNVTPSKNTIHPQPQNQSVLYDSYAKDQDSFKVALALPKLKFSGDLKDLDEKVNSMIDRSENMLKHSEGKMTKAYACQVCGKEGLGIVIRRHVEANHLGGISIPCNVCDKTVSTRLALQKHNSRHHKNSIC